MGIARLPIISMWLASFIMSISIGVYNPIIPLLQADLNFTYAQVGLMTTAMIFSYAALQLPSSHLREHIGSKRLIIFGLLAMTVSTFLLGFITNTTQAYALRFIAGMGMAGVFVPAMNVIIHLLRDRGKGFAIGMYGMAQAVGFIFVSLLAPILAVEVGWR
ncbi:MAG: MFS transporter, partial [Nitrosopumilus sp.]